MKGQETPVVVEERDDLANSTRGDDPMERMMRERSEGRFANPHKAPSNDPEFEHESEAEQRERQRKEGKAQEGKAAAAAPDAINDIINLKAKAAELKEKQGL